MIEIHLQFPEWAGFFVVAALVASSVSSLLKIHRRILEIQRLRDALKEPQ